MRRQGFTLVELLVALGILSLLLGVVLAFTQSSARLERTQRAQALLAEDLSLTATVLAREVYLAGYKVSSGNPFILTAGTSNDDKDEIVLRFFCETDTDMELYCSSRTMGAVRRVAYRLANQTLYWGACKDGDCANFQASHPVMDGVEVFRVAYRSGGSWSRSEVRVSASASGNNPKVEMVAVYLLARSPVRTGAPAFTPGSTVDWSAVPDGDALRSVLGLGALTLTQDGHPRAERLVAVQTPNLAR